MKVKRYRRPSDEGMVDPEILKNRGFTDKELACLPWFVRWAKAEGGKEFTNRFTDQGAAAHWLGICGDRDYLVYEHNVPVEDAA